MLVFFIFFNTLGWKHLETRKSNAIYKRMLQTYFSCVWKIHFVVAIWPFLNIINGIKYPFIIVWPFLISLSKVTAIVSQGNIAFESFQVVLNWWFECQNTKQNCFRSEGSYRIMYTQALAGNLFSLSFFNKKVHLWKRNKAKE